MKFADALRGYCPVTEEEEKEVWGKCVFCFDTNALLDVYRYSDEGRVAFLQVLAAIKERLFVPGRVAEEFARNRATVIRSRFAPHRFVRQKLKEVYDKLPKEHKDHPELKAVTGFVDELRALDINKFKAAEDQQDALYDEDAILRDLLANTPDEVGDPFPVEELAEEYARRKESAIPPHCGDDDDKDEIGRVGDVAVWLEVLGFCSRESKPLIFITGDLKQNWWVATGVRDVPQPALVREFYQRTQQSVLFYTPKVFLNAVARRLQIPESKQLATEAEDLSQRDRRKMDHLKARMQQYASKRDIEGSSFNVLEKWISHMAQSHAADEAKVALDDFLPKLRQAGIEPEEFVQRMKMAAVFSESDLVSGIAEEMRKQGWADGAVTPKRVLAELRRLAEKIERGEINAADE